MEKLISNVFIDSNYKPSLFINALKTDLTLKSYYETQVRHYTLEEHTLLVMKEFEKYFSDASIPIRRNLFRLLLALHDIGKPKAYQYGDKSKQYIYTKEIINNLKPNLLFSNHEIDLCISIVCCDPIGMYFQNKVSLNATVGDIKSKVSQINMSVENFFRLISIYYQVDVGSYTEDAGGYKFLEYLFEYNNGLKTFNDERKILKFSPDFEIKYSEIEESLLNE